MPQLKLTKRMVERLVAPDPSGKQTLYWDEDLKGFGLLVSGRTAAKTWVVQHRLKDGRTRRVTIGPANVYDPEKARDLAKAQLGELYQGRDPKAAKRSRRKTTLRQAMNDYLTTRAELRPRSKEEYRRAIERDLSDWLDRPLFGITADMVAARYAAIREQVAQREAARLKAARKTAKAQGEAEPGTRRIAFTGVGAANAAMRALRATWNHVAAQEAMLPSADPLPPNPVGVLKTLSMWVKIKRRETFVSGDQLPAFYQAVLGLKNDIARDYVLLLLFTGLRRREAAALRWDEIDFAARVVRLPEKRTKNGVALDIPMTDFVRDLLVARRAQGTEGGFVFPGNGASGHLEEPKEFFDAIRKACGVDVSPHDLRRTFITVAANVSISSMALKALVNHGLGDDDVTEGYARLTTEQLRQPAQLVCDELKRLCQIETAVASAENIEKLA